MSSPLPSYTSSCLRQRTVAQRALDPTILISGRRNATKILWVDFARFRRDLDLEFIGRRDLQVAFLPRLDTLKRSCIFVREFEKAGPELWCSVS